MVLEAAVQSDDPGVLGVIERVVINLERKKGKSEGEMREGER
jgi:hypothetical protein